ncbi:MAG: metal-dependent hydrolase [Candidatus Aminicenantes bacterium]|nr:metal-dependent hydrolase [Candidatus Aminicenantes bacterium]
MSPVAHSALGLLGWELGASRKTWPSLALFVLAANLADLDFLFAFLFGRRPLFVHQAYTHNIFFVLAASGLLALALSKGRGRRALVLTGLSHLAADIFVVDAIPPVGFRLFFPFSEALFNVPLFPYLVRPPYGPVFSPRNIAVLGLEAAVFVLPVLAFCSGRLKGRLSRRAVRTS